MLSAFRGVQLPDDSTNLYKGKGFIEIEDIDSADRAVLPRA